MYGIHFQIVILNRKPAAWSGRHGANWGDVAAAVVCAVSFYAQWDVANFTGSCDSSGMCCSIFDLCIRDRRTVWKHTLIKADDRTSYHLMFFITLENIKSKDRKNWDIFDHLCNEIANEESDVSETVEIQLLMSLFKMKDHDPDLLIFLG